MKQVLLYGVIGGALIAILKLIEYHHFIQTFPAELYGGLVALIFTGVGVYLGLRWMRAKEVVVIRDVVRDVVREVVVREEVLVRDERPFAPDDEKRRELAITPREHEILGLIAEGLSNREIGERLFVSENTVKTHSARLFDKLGVNRRVQAVQKGRELGLIP